MKQLFLAAGIACCTLPAQAAWEMSTKVDPMTDATSYTLINLPTKMVEGEDFTDVALIIGCSDNRTDLSVLALEAFFGTFADKRFAYRIDASPMKDVAAIGHDAVLSVRPNPIAVIKEMMTGDTLLVEAIPIGSRFIAEFDISGLSEAIRPLRDACNW